MYVVGYTQSSDYPVTPNGIKLIKTAGWDGILSVLDPSGSTLIYSTLFGGDYLQVINGVEFDRTGNIYLNGETASSDFPVTPGGFQLKPAGSKDAFIVKITKQEIFTPTDGIPAACIRGISVSQNFPNPFSGAGTVIKYTLRKDMDVTLSVFDATGKLVSSQQFLHAVQGEHEYGLQTADLHPGIYFYSLEADGTRMTKKMVRI